jgi:hypothetical protein
VAHQACESQQWHRTWPCQCACVFSLALLPDDPVRSFLLSTLPNHIIPPLADSLYYPPHNRVRAPLLSAACEALQLGVLLRHFFLHYPPVLHRISTLQARARANHTRLPAAGLSGTTHPLVRTSRYFYRYRTPPVIILHHARSPSPRHKIDIADIRFSH